MLWGVCMYVCVCVCVRVCVYVRVGNFEIMVLLLSQRERDSVLLQNILSLMWLWGWISPLVQYEGEIPENLRSDLQANRLHIYNQWKKKKGFSPVSGVLLGALVESVLGHVYWLCVRLRGQLCGLGGDRKKERKKERK